MKKFIFGVLLVLPLLLSSKNIDEVEVFGVSLKEGYKEDVDKALNGLEMSLSETHQGVGNTIDTYETDSILGMPGIFKVQFDDNTGKIAFFFYEVRLADPNKKDEDLFKTMKKLFKPSWSEWMAFDEVFESLKMKYGEPIKVKRKKMAFEARYHWPISEDVEVALEMFYRKKEAPQNKPNPFFSENDQPVQPGTCYLTLFFDNKKVYSEILASNERIKKEAEETKRALSEKRKSSAF